MIEFDLFKLIPGFLRNDRNCRALAAALQRALELMDGIVAQGVACVTDVDSMPEWRLDEMAWELNTAWYDYSASLADKRQTIRDARKYYIRLGTPAAILNALNGVFGSGRVEEWWQYGGEPYHFRVYTTNLDAVGAYYNKFVQTLSAARNVRSVLDSIQVIGIESTASFYTAAAAAGAAAAATATARPAT